MELALNIFGWIGSAMVVTGFFLVSNGKIEAQTYKFQMLNFIASIFVGINAYYYGALPSVGINTVWCLIAIAAMIRIRLQQKKGLEH